MRHLILLVVLGACTEEVDTSRLAPIAGYQSWASVTATGKVPGHDGTYRVIYANEVAETYPHSGRYPVGTVIVKEVYEERGGSLEYLAIMRKVPEGADVGVAVQEGWVFTFAESRDDGKEEHTPTCFQNCHLQGPIDRAWLDYGK
jgi:hypothetical protein